MTNLERRLPSIVSVRRQLHRGPRGPQLTRVRRNANGYSRLDRRDHLLQLTYFLDCKDQGELAKLMDELKTGIPDCSFSFIDQSNVPG